MTSDSKTAPALADMTSPLRRGGENTSRHICATCQHGIVHRIEPDDLVLCLRCNNYVFRDDSRECAMWEDKCLGDRELAGSVISLLRKRARTECDTCSRGGECGECFVRFAKVAADQIEVCI